MKDFDGVTQGSTHRRVEGVDRGSSGNIEDAGAQFSVERCLEIFLRACREGVDDYASGPDAAGQSTISLPLM